MVCVVGVRFKKAGKVYYFDPDAYGIEPGAKVVVETARGVEYGEVAVGPKDVTDDQVVQPLKKVLRVATEKDAILAADNKRKERESFSIAQKKIETHTLDMNLVDVEYTFDGSKVIFYFTAEGRVDFRELVRDLASVFRTRIEMRQIGVRDEAKLLGGIGPCGRILCCTSFLGDFAPVSIRMAKDQNLSLNPSKISGLCGRLMCCLRYEQDTYEAAKKDPTLAPGYVPPVLLQEGGSLGLDELEDRPTPAIGFRAPRDASGMSARIAQAAGLAEKPVRREERPDKRQGSERPQGADRSQASSLSQPSPKPVGGNRPQGGEKPQQKPQQQKGQPHGQQPGKPNRGGPQQQPGKPQGQRPQGEQPGRNQTQQGRSRPQGQQPPKHQAGGKPQGGDQAQRPAGEQQRSRPPRHRRKGNGDRSQPGTETRDNGGE